MTTTHIIITGEAGHGKDTIGNYLVANHGYVRTAFADPLKNEVIASYAGSPAPVNMDFINNRDTKKVPMERLALRHCSDPDFVKLALNVFIKEDQELFLKLRQAVKDHPGFPVDSLMVGGRTLREVLEGPGFSEADRLSLPRSARRICQLWGTEYRRSQSVTYWVDQQADFIARSDKPVVICDGRFPDECEWADSAHLRRINVFRPGFSDTTVKHASEEIPPPCARTAILTNDSTEDNFQGLYKQIEQALARFKLESGAHRPRLAA